MAQREFGWAFSREGRRLGRARRGTTPKATAGLEYPRASKEDVKKLKESQGRALKKKNEGRQGPSQTPQRTYGGPAPRRRDRRSKAEAEGAGRGCDRRGSSRGGGALFLEGRPRGGRSES